MKKLLLWMFAFGMFAACALQAQEIAGTWQGTMQLKSGKELRIVLKITKAKDGVLNGKFYNLDQHWQGLDNDPVSLQGTTMKFEVPERGLKYEGKLSTDGAAITGTATVTEPGMMSTGMSIPLNLQHATNATAWVLPEAPVKVAPMAAAADPSFEVATIKPTAPGDHGDGTSINGRHLAMLRISLIGLITVAYDLEPKQIAGGPDWAGTDQYDIAAVIDTEGEPSEKQFHAMLQKLLKERFNLSFHYETKDLPAYALVSTGKLGPKITKSENSPDADPDFFGHGLGHRIIRNATMLQFAHDLQTILGRPIVDKTGLTGRYDLTLDWAPDESQYPGTGFRIPPPAEGMNALPALFTAMQEQLGMKLVATKTKVDVLVIDHVEKPSAN